MNENNKIGALFREFGASYRALHSLSLAQQKTMRAIERCRTADLGGHVDRCDSCGYERIFYNSCRNRHCPNCQSLARERWLLDRKRELLPIVYFHLVFTIPDELNPIALVNQRPVYDVLFQAASETLLMLGRDPRHIGGQIGLIAVLHTWGQNLMDHPHLHCIVTGGALSDDGQRWLSPVKTKRGKNFFIHVNVISDLFKKKFLTYLKQRYQAGKFKWVGRISYLKERTSFDQFLTQLYAKKWVTYCKKPFGGPEQVLHYLGCYTHRVAISNQRIVKVFNGKVTFKWRDYRDSDKSKLMTLEVFEFIRRFLLHILPSRYYKIRYYGFLANRFRNTRLSRCKDILSLIKPATSAKNERMCWEDVLLELCGLDVRKCPNCQSGRMVRKEILYRSAGVPP